jgi:hypothetical protein
MGVVQSMDISTLHGNTVDKNPTSSSKQGQSAFLMPDHPPQALSVLAAYHLNRPVPSATQINNLS